MYTTIRRSREDHAIRHLNHYRQTNHPLHHHKKSLSLTAAIEKEGLYSSKNDKRKSNQMALIILSLGILSSLLFLFTLASIG